MADVKISGLPASTTPLAGTEVLPIVQSGVTVKTPVSSLLDGFSNTGTGNNVRATNPRIDSFISAGDVKVQNGSAFTTANAVVQSWTGYAGSLNQFPFAAIEFVTGDFVDWGGLVFKSTNTGTPTEGFRLTPAGNIAFPSGKGIDFSATPGTGTSELLADYEEGDWVPTDASGAGLTLTVAAAYYTKVGRVVTLTGRVTYPVNASAVQARITCPFATIGPTAFVTSTNFPSTVTGYANGTSMYFYVDAQGAISNTNASTVEFNISFTYITT